MSNFYNAITNGYKRQSVNDALRRFFDARIVDISLESQIIFLASGNPDIKEYLTHKLGSDAQKILEENLKQDCKIKISLMADGLFNVLYVEGDKAVINEDLTYNVLLTNDKRYLPLPMRAKHLWVMEFANLFMRYIKDTSNVFDKYHE